MDHFFVVWGIMQIYVLCTYSAVFTWQRISNMKQELAYLFTESCPSGLSCEITAKILLSGIGYRTLQPLPKAIEVIDATGGLFANVCHPTGTWKRGVRTDWLRGQKYLIFNPDKGASQVNSKHARSYSLHGIYATVQKPNMSPVYLWSFWNTTLVAIWQGNQ